jgi:hypothetical protein
MRTVVGIIAIVSCVACGKSDDDAQKDSSSASSTKSTAQATMAEPISLSAADIDGFVNGMKREIALVKDANHRALTATSPGERGNAIQSAFEENTIAGAVPASGLSLERYRLVRHTIAKILVTLDFQGKIDGPQSVDTTLADSAMKARLASDPYSVLDAASAAELKARLSTIVPVWVEYATLTAVNG